LKKLTHRGVLTNRLFQRLQQQETVEKVQQEEKSLKPFQGTVSGFFYGREN
jgi:hypothetical protein